MWLYSKYPNFTKLSANQNLWIPLLSTIGMESISWFFHTKFCHSVILCELWIIPNDFLLVDIMQACNIVEQSSAWSFMLHALLYCSVFTMGICIYSFVLFLVYSERYWFGSFLSYTFFIWLHDPLLILIHYNAIYWYCFIIWS